MQSYVRILNKLQQGVSKRCAGVSYSFGPAEIQPVPGDVAAFLLGEWPDIFGKADADIAATGKQRLEFVAHNKQFNEKNPFCVMRDSVPRKFVPGDVVWMEAAEAVWFRERMNRHGCSLVPARNRFADAAPAQEATDNMVEDKPSGIGKWHALRAAAKEELAVTGSSREELLPRMFLADEEHAKRILDRLEIEYSEVEVIEAMERMTLDGTA